PEREAEPDSRRDHQRERRGQQPRSKIDREKGRERAVIDDRAEPGGFGCLHGARDIGMSQPFGKALATSRARDSIRSQSPADMAVSGATQEPLTAKTEGSAR